MNVSNAVEPYALTCAYAERIAAHAFDNGNFTTRAVTDRITVAQRGSPAPFYLAHPVF